MIGAELLAERDAGIGTGGRDDARADHVLGDLNADRAEIAAGAHDQHGLIEFEIGDMDQEIPRRRHVPQYDCGAMKVEMLGERDRSACRDVDQFGETPGPLDPHHAAWPVIAAAVLGADVERHKTRGGDMIANPPAADLRSDRIDNASAIDTGNERQRGAAGGFLAGAQADIEHAIDGRGMHPDADFAGARDGIGDLLVAQNVGRPEFVNDDGFHS